MGIANIINTSTSSGGGEIIRELSNSSDGQGLHFDGATGNIDIATPPDLGAKFSFEFVVKADEWGSDAGYFLDFSNGGRFIFGTTSSQSYNISIYDNTSWGNFGVKVLDDLKIHHLVVTVDGTAATLYDNGNQVGTLTISASHGIDSCSDLTIGPGGTGTPMSFYRTRFYNKTLTQAEVDNAYQRADVDFADQYGSETSKLLNGTAWTGASGTTAPNSWTTGNQGTYTIDSSSGSGSEPALKIARSIDNPYIHQNFTAVIGAKYRISYKVKNIDATQANIGIGSSAIGSQYYLLGYSSTDWQTVNLEITATTNLISVYLQAITSTGTQAVYFDSVEIKQIGAVTDYDLAFANPTQSLMVQDRAGVADGTASASGVSQTQKIVQLNATAIAVSQATARTPANGEIVADTVSVIGTGHDAANISITNTGSNNARLLLNSGHGNWSVCNSDTIGDALEFRDESAAATRMSISSAGNVSINASGADQKRNLNIHGTNGSSEQQTFTIESDGENAKANFKLGIGGGAASTKMTISSAGNVGINVASPGYKLDVEESSGNEIARFQGANSGSLVMRNDAANVFRMYAGAGDSLGLSGGNVSASSHLEISSAGAITAGGNITIAANDPQLILSDSNGTNKLVELRSNNGVAELVSRDNAANGIFKFIAEAGSTETTHLEISSAGNVAIGSSVASEKLHLMADGSVGTRIERASNDGNSGVLDFYKTRGTLASKSVVGTADTVGALRAFGYDGSNYIQGGEIAFKTNGTPGTNDMPTQFVVSTTADGASSPTDRLTISSAGDVSIGSTSSASGGQLHVDDALGAIIGLSRTTGAATQNLGQIRFGNTNVDSNLASIAAVQDGGSDNSRLEFRTQASGSEAATRVKIDKAGLATFLQGVTVSGGFTTLGGFNDLTIASGAVTATSSTHNIDTEGGGATDYLDTINGGSTGSIITLMAASGSRTVVVEDGTNLKLAGDCTLDNAEDTITLIKSGSAWHEVSRSNNGA